MTQERKDKIRESMLTDYYYLLPIMVKKFMRFFPAGYEDELESYLNVEYVNAWDTWDEEKSSWPTYVTNVLRTRSIAHAGYLTRQRRVSPWITDSLDMPLFTENEDGESMCLHDIVADTRQERYDLMYEAEDTLTYLLQYLRDEKDLVLVFGLLEEGTHKEDIAKQLDVSLKTVYRYKDRIAEKLRPIYKRMGGDV